MGSLEDRQNEWSRNSEGTGAPSHATGAAANQPEGPFSSPWEQLKARFRLLISQGNDRVDPHGSVSWGGARNGSY